MNVQSLNDEIGYLKNNYMMELANLVKENNELKTILKGVKQYEVQD